MQPVEANAKVVRAYVMYNGITLCVEDRFEVSARAHMCTVCMHGPA